MLVLGYNIVQPESNIFWFWTATRNIKWLSGVHNNHIRFHLGFKEIVLIFFFSGNRKHSVRPSTTAFNTPQFRGPFLRIHLTSCSADSEDILRFYNMMACYSLSEQPNCNSKSWNELHSDFYLNKGTVQSCVIHLINTLKVAFLHE